MHKKSNLEIYIKNVRLVILSNDMEIVPVKIMLNAGEAILLEGYFNNHTAYWAAKRILKNYVGF